jgi:MFS family permease
MQDLFALLILVIVSAVTLIAFFLAIRLFFPQRVNLVQKAAEENNGRAFLLGLVNTLFFAAIIVGLTALTESTGIGLLSVLALLLMAVFVIVLALGLTAVIQMVGIRLMPDATENRRFLLGGLVVVLGSLTPFVGWFGLFLYVSFVGVGSVIISLFAKSKRKPVQESLDG